MKTDNKDREKMVGILKRMQELELDDEEQIIDPEDVEKMELNELLGLLSADQLKEFNEFIKTDSVQHLIKIRDPWWKKEIKTRETVQVAMEIFNYNIKTNPELIYSSIELVYSYIKAYRTVNCELDSEFLDLFKQSFVLENNFIFQSVDEVMDLVHECFIDDLKTIYKSQENVLCVFQDVIQYLQSTIGTDIIKPKLITEITSEKPKTRKGNQENFLLLKKLQYYHSLVKSMEISPLYESMINYKKIEHRELIKEM
ncbi:hypothetical protein HDV01_004940 [Terramyces sp. JEL0728]|nr:hypothetical protein HDV01_004940 [Terramyces sp. JEL0728]